MEQQNSLKKRMEYGKKVSQIHANLHTCSSTNSNNAVHRKNSKSLPGVFIAQPQPAAATIENAEHTKSPMRSKCRATQFMHKRLEGKSNRNSCSLSLPRSSSDDGSNNTTKILMKKPQFMTAAKSRNMAYGGTRSDNSDAGAESTKTEIKSRYRQRQTKSTGSSSVDYGKFDESKLEEMRMRHKIGMQYVNKLAEEMKL